MRSQKVIEKQIRKSLAKWYLINDTKPHIHLREGSISTYIKDSFLWEMHFDTPNEFNFGDLKMTREEFEKKLSIFSHTKIVQPKLFSQFNS